MPDISYFDAWRMWSEGRSTLGNDLLGMPMIWLGRLGKITAFASGATIVLDIVGPTRLRAAQVQIDRPTETNLVVHFVTLIAAGIIGMSAAIYVALRNYPLWHLTGSKLETPANITLVIVAAIAGTGAGCAIWFALTALVHWTADGFRHPTAAPLRLVAATLLLIGFHFDLLAS
ncbi:hypothetical protein [Sphaerisporangium corydalis]|uniref:Yip1 domain-containing protein n=1 Tax=Sphaerisporangium corydalis TaxID=1441875 RepID=A0ABV9EJ57_9ACTN|nr:hypothetical protein [Sphaerisporangium corydalis]